jgi:hypothetical protein
MSLVKGGHVQAEACSHSLALCAGELHEARLTGAAISALGARELQSVSRKPIAWCSHQQTLHWRDEPETCGSRDHRSKYNTEELDHRSGPI